MYVQAAFAFIGYFAAAKPGVLNYTIFLVPTTYYIGMTSALAVFLTFIYDLRWFAEGLRLFARAVGWMLSVLETIYFGTILIVQGAGSSGLIVSIVFFSLVGLTIVTVDLLQKSFEKLSSRVQQFPQKSGGLILKLTVFRLLLRLGDHGRTYSTPLFGASLTFGLTLAVSAFLDGNLIPWRNSTSFVNSVVFILSLSWWLLSRDSLKNSISIRFMKTKFSQPVVAVLSVPTIDKGEFAKIARGPNITPDEWSDRLKSKGLTVKVETDLRISSQNTIILNPFGESYPENDVANMATFRRVKDYIRSGGVFVNINGLAFFYMWDPATHVEALTGDPTTSYQAVTLLKRRGIRKTRAFAITTQLVQGLNPDEASIVDTWLFRAFGIRTSVGSSRSLNVTEVNGFQSILEDDQPINEFRAPLRSEISDTFLIPMLRAQYKYGTGEQARDHECYPIAAVKYGLGYLVIMGIDMTDERHYTLVPSLLQVILRKISETGTLLPKRI